MKKAIFYSFAAALLALGLAGCREQLSDDNTYKPPKGEPGLGASFEGKFNRYQKGQKHPGQGNAWKIQQSWADTMWLNDRTHMQVVVWTNDEDFDGLSYEVSDLKNGANTIAKSNVRLRFGSYVLGDVTPASCTSPDPRPEARVADALTETAITSVTAADPVKIWVTVDTPKNAVPGKYTGTIKVKAEGGEVHSLDLSILVVDRTLPDVRDWTFHLDLWQFPFQLRKHCSPAVEFASDGYFTLMEPIYKMLADAGQKAVTAYIKDGAFLTGDETMVKWTKKGNGTWDFDYTRFDRFVEKMMSWGIDKQIDCFSLAGWNYGVPYRDEASGTNKTQQFDSSAATAGTNPKIGSAEYKALWTAFLDSFKAHLNAKGWFAKTVLYMDEINHDDMEAIINLIREHDAGWKIGLAGSNLGDLEDNMYDYSVFLTRDSKKATPVKTFYTSCSHLKPNNYVTPVNSPAEMAWMGWHAAGNGYNGYLRWAYDYWRTGDPANARDTGATAGDCSMVYYKNSTSAGNGVVAATRMELLREGIQDYEKIRILNNSELNAFAATVDVESGQRAAFYVGKGEGLIAKLSVK